MLKPIRGIPGIPLSSRSIDLEREGAVGAQHGAEDRARVDDRQAFGLSPLTHKLPRRPLGDRLRAR